MHDYGLPEAYTRQSSSHRHVPRKVLQFGDYWVHVEESDSSRQWIPVENLLTENDNGVLVLCDAAVAFFDSVRREYQARNTWQESPEQAAAKQQQMKQFLTLMKKDWPEFWICVQRKCTHNHGLPPVPGCKPKLSPH